MKHPQKKVGCLWSLCHGAMAIKAWHSTIISSASVAWQCCNTRVAKTQLHCFQACNLVRYAWKFAVSILYQLLQVLYTN
jgi:hypothetical protein